jgi:ABC-2 type transport system permease protein
VTYPLVLDESQFSAPGRGRGLLDVFRYRYLLRLLVRKGTLTRYHGSVLGWAWSYVKPAMQFVLFYLVFGLFLGLNKGIPNFPIYLFSGIVVMNLFTEAFNNATRAIVDNAPLVQKIYLPRELFPIAAVIVAFVHFLPQVIILFAASLIAGWTPTVVQVLGIFLAMLLTVFLAVGLGLLFGSVNVSFRDSQNVVELILLFATWISPVLYYWTMVRDKVSPLLLRLYLLNPLTGAVELMHDGFWLPTVRSAVERPSHLIITALISLAITLVILVIGQFVFRKMEGRFAQDL